MSDSIFDTVKKSLGVEADFTGFDSEILLGINTSIMNLNQLGIGPTDGLVITGSDQHWSQLIGTATDYEGVKLYVCLQTKISFDPPSSSFILESYRRTVEQLEWRIREQVEADLTKPTPTP